MIELGKIPNDFHIADWVELSCLFGKRNSISRADLTKTLEELNDKEPENTAMNIWLEMTRRQKLLINKYPIVLQNGRMEARDSWHKNLGYSFQLLVSSHTSYKVTTIPKQKWNEVAKLFERFSASALKNYFNAKVILFGSPRGDELPEKFHKCIDHVCGLLNEKRGSSYCISKKANDEEVDVIGWIPFPDGRPSQLIILAQCAAGKDWKDKLDEPNIRKWHNIIDSLATPITAFAFPHICKSSSLWNEIAYDNGGIVFDRLRLTYFCTLETEIRKDILSWSKEQVSKLPQLS
jgi:hypothetical protein